MADDTGEMPTEPGELRKRLEAQIARNKDLTTFAVERVREAHPLVQAEDLTDAPPGEWLQRAQSLQSERQAAQDQALRQALLSKGHPAEVVEALMSGKPSTEEAAPAPALAGFGTFGVQDVAGRTPGAVPLTEGLHGPDAIYAHFVENPSPVKGKR